MEPVGCLFTQRHLDEAKEIYSRARTGFRALQGPSSDECQPPDLSHASLDPTQGKRRENSPLLT